MTFNLKANWSISPGNRDLDTWTNDKNEIVKPPDELTLNLFLAQLEDYERVAARLRTLKGQVRITVTEVPLA